MLNETKVLDDGTTLEIDKVAQALRRITETYYAYAGAGRLGSDKPAWVAYSGGKDSTVLLDLVRRSGIPYEAHYSVTSVDPPELVEFIKTQPDVIMDIPRYADGTPITMWNLIPRRMVPPTRIMRYCCGALKESSGKGRLTLTGVRWAESTRRKNSWGIVNLNGKRKLNKAAELGIPLKSTGTDRGAFDPLDYASDDLAELIDGYREPDEKTIMQVSDNDRLRRMMEYCSGRGKTTLNPIIDWSDEDVWEYIEQENLPYCSLYTRAGGCYTRLGCISCPMQGGRRMAEDLQAHPKYKEAYLRAFDRMLKARREANLPCAEWNDAEEVMTWWITPVQSKKNKPAG